MPECCSRCDGGTWHWMGPCSFVSTMMERPSGGDLAIFVKTWPFSYRVRRTPAVEKQIVWWDWVRIWSLTRAGCRRCLLGEFEEDDRRPFWVACLSNELKLDSEWLYQIFSEQCLEIANRSPSSGVLESYEVAACFFNMDDKTSSRFWAINSLCKGPLPYNICHMKYLEQHRTSICSKNTYSPRRMARRTCWFGTSVILTSWLR